MGRLKSLGFRVRAQGERLKTGAPGSWRTGKTSTERGYDYRWQQAREQYLRDHPLCVYCERKGLVTAANTVDHIVAHRGDQDLFWDQDNWQPLCGPCHSSVKQAEEAAGG
ncbi:HNH endonuclease [Pseudomonas aeruginosa]|uniref:HNH endonuclease n=1 Tax=Pseudomonas aeruginosa TaxID=287 RepID=UPI001067CE69|nr:HNH endonuclease signature motif containing protein [Pseudomonas aeruginosa]MCO2745521.1 HNH endonuclease [Pseudomonas aeruginosa]MCO2844600.1 HNH endonuclease [Pseudomonas aeruginosa]MCO2862344.1 HNH endonuclease [Pseudomonas aeruginosa]TEG64105.1 HNH endonuclease [Pseudomonas aeruginosa]HBP4947635.1 HNH endonuclease [Pseudomonas aeruginosa]